MPSDDEFRRVAEDMRALARSLARDIHSAADRFRDETQGVDGSGGLGPGPGPRSRSRERRSAREDFADAGRAARREIRRAQSAFRRSAQHHHHYPHDPGDEGEDDVTSPSADGPAAGCPPRWDNWGGYYRQQRNWVDARHADWTRPGRDAGVAVQERAPKPARTPKPARNPAPPVRHRHDGSTLLGLVALVFGLAWLAAGTHLAHVSTVAVVATALMIVGAAVVVTARTDWALSRRSWPVLGGALLAATLLAFSVSPNLPVGFQHLSFGSRMVTPSSWAGVPATVHGGFGRTNIDLSGLAGPPPQPRTITVDNAAGQLVITLPANLRVVVNAAVAAGQISINGQRMSGLGRSEDMTLSPNVPGPALTLKVQSGFGDTMITQLPVVSTPSPDPIPPSPPGVPTTTAVTP